MPVSEGACPVVTREPDRNPGSPITSGTRTLYEPELCEVLLLKDGWCAELPEMVNEIETFLELGGVCVCHIPHFVKGSDV